MKQFKFFLLSVISLLYSISMSAHDFEVDGIYYNITSATDKTVEVTYRGDKYNSYSNEYSGAVNILEIVNYNGVKYNVTRIGEYTFSSCLPQGCLVCKPMLRTDSPDLRSRSRRQAV